MTGSGAALYVYDKSAANVTASQLHDNTAAVDGGALYFLGRCNGHVLDTSLDRNEAGRSGGAASIQTVGSLHVRGGYLRDNVARSVGTDGNVMGGGAVHMYQDIVASMHDTVVSGNAAVSSPSARAGCWGPFAVVVVAWAVGSPSSLPSLLLSLAVAVLVAAVCRRC